MKKTALLSIIVTLSTILLTLSIALAWYDETHLAVGKAAGDKKWYNAAGPDIAKEKAGLIEQQNHFFNNYSGVEITPKLVIDQISRYNRPDDEEGHLYGAIIAALREYANRKKDNKYSLYHVSYCAHYIGDLSQPQHNTPRDQFNRDHHDANEAIAENLALNNLGKVKENMYAIALRADHFEEDLAKEIARIANVSRQLDAKLRKENRDMTSAEVYRQLGHSSSLLEAVLHYLKL